ncbi:MAG: prepilin-type N-terminal cleavage/methylation domain-containing protein [Candidatus Dojkabacteria bacterium]|nr:prepilin-type N-terminal cleavage/methylation domain-containing protein [Candidatus Dojkabacteria bacterium]
MRLNLALKTNLLHKKISGFSLIELLISMVIFMVVLLVLSTLFMRVLDLSVAQDAKNSFLTQIQNIALNIKNTFRNTKSFVVCSQNNNMSSNAAIVMSLNNDDIKIVRYANRSLEEKTISVTRDLGGSSNSSNNSSYCDYNSSMSRMHAANVQINSFLINVKSDIPSIQIIYITINACSRDLLPRLNLYHCDGSNSSEYRYSFAVVARNK